MKPIIAAMAPPTAEAMMVASVLSTTLTADKTRGIIMEINKSTFKQFKERFQEVNIPNILAALCYNAFLIQEKLVPP